MQAVTADNPGEMHAKMLSVSLVTSFLIQAPSGWRVAFANRANGAEPEV